MILIWKVQQPTGDTALLQDIEKSETLRDRQPIVLGAVDNQLWCVELQDVLGSRRVPATVVVSVGPEGPIELEIVSLSD